MSYTLTYTLNPKDSNNSYLVSGYTGEPIDIEIPSNHSENGKPIKGIRDRAFSNCKTLKSVKFSEGSQLTNIENMAFYNCSSLISIELPDTLVEIGTYAFSGCTSLKNINIGKNLNAIRSSAFRWCSSLTNLEIPSNVKIIETAAFQECTFDSLVIEGDAGTTLFNSAAFTKCEIKKIRVPSSVLPIIRNSLLEEAIVTSGSVIPNDAFNGCSNLKIIELPESIETISSRAFQNCISLENINLPKNITKIDQYAFSDCIKLASIEIPNKVEEIGSYCFSGCSSLKSIIIPENVITIGKYAFNNCALLGSIYLLPRDVPNTGGNLLNNIPNIDKVKLYCFSSSITDYINATNWSAYASNFIPDDIRIAALLNSKAQKKYFVSKNELPEKVSTIISGLDITAERLQTKGSLIKKINESDNSIDIDGVTYTEKTSPDVFDPSKNTINLDVVVTKGKLNPNGGAIGNSAVAFGIGNTAAGRNNFVTGTRNYTNGNETSAFGQGNCINAAYAFGIGANNLLTNGSNYSFVSGDKNTLNKVRVSTVGGGTNTVEEGEYLFVHGRNIKVKNINSSFVFGYANEISGTDISNTTGNNNIILGSGNTAKEIQDNNIILGHKIEIDGQKSGNVLIGCGLTSINNDAYIIGTYNKTDENDDGKKYSFIFANGVNENNRRNILTLPHASNATQVANLECDLEINGKITNSKEIKTGTLRANTRAYLNFSEHDLGLYTPKIYMGGFSGNDIIFNYDSETKKVVAKNLSSVSITDVPTEDTHATNKKYVDEAISAGLVSNSNNSTVDSEFICSLY